ncbi:hypothetical protein UT300013_35590 [Paraclostridium sordellii]
MLLEVSLIISGALFLFSSLLFIFKEKAIFLINGYSIISRGRREMFDEAKICKDYGIILLKYSLILLIGSIGYILFSKTILVVAIVIWVIYLAKTLVTFNFDNYKVINR